MQTLHIELYYYRRCRLELIQTRRHQNRVARLRGFRNYAEMTEWR
jgi:hypothetical protein